MKIGLIGTFDVDNFGDCMFPELYDSLLRAHMPDVVVSLYSPRPEPAEILSYGVVRALPSSLPDAAATFEDDVLVLVGGETIGLGHSSGTYNFRSGELSAFSRLWLAPAQAQSVRGDVRFIAHCVGVGSLDETISTKVGGVVGAIEHFTFREVYSRNRLGPAATQVPVCTDPMFLIDELLPAQEWQHRAERLLPAGWSAGAYLVGQISPSYIDRSGWVHAMAEIAKHTGLGVVLLPICHFLQDEELLEQCRRDLVSMDVPVTLIRGRINVKDTAAVIGCSGGFCGTSLHGAVTAISFGVPVSVLAHSRVGKHAGVFRQVGVEHLVVDDASLLPRCMADSRSMDRRSLSERAHRDARQGFDRIVEALGLPAAVTADVSAAVSELVAWERRNARRRVLFSLKRLGLRTIARSDRAQAAYRSHRIRRTTH